METLPLARGDAGLPLDFRAKGPRKDESQVSRKHMAKIDWISMNDFGKGI